MHIAPSANAIELDTAKGPTGTAIEGVTALKPGQPPDHQDHIARIPLAKATGTKLGSIEHFQSTGGELHIAPGALAIRVDSAKSPTRTAIEGVTALKPGQPLDHQDHVACIPFAQGAGTKLGPIEHFQRTGGELHIAPGTSASGHDSAIDPTGKAINGVTTLKPGRVLDI